MNIRIGGDYNKELVKTTKKLSDSTSELSKKLSKTRDKISNSYIGDYDYETQLKAIEKKLNKHSENMKNVKANIESAVNNIVEADNKWRSSNLQPTEKKKKDSNPIMSFISNVFGKAWGLLSSLLGLGNIVSPATTTTPVPEEITQTTEEQPPKTVDDYINEHYELYEEALEEMKTENPELYKRLKYEEYRKQAELVRDCAPNQRQVYQVDKNGYKLEKDGEPAGRCNVAATTQLINNKLTLDGRGTEDYYKDAEWCIKNTRNSHGNLQASDVKKYTGTSRYKNDEGIEYIQYSGGTDGNYYTKYENLYYEYGEDGKQYSVSYQMTEDTVLAKKLQQNKNDSEKCRQMIADLLDKHPEGIVYRSNGHVVVIQNYEIVDGKIELYVQDGISYGNYPLYGKLENSWMFASACGNSEKNFFNCGRISHIETVKTEVK